MLILIFQFDNDSYLFLNRFLLEPTDLKIKLKYTFFIQIFVEAASKTSSSIGHHPIIFLNINNSVLWKMLSVLIRFQLWINFLENFVELEKY